MTNTQAVSDARTSTVTARLTLAALALIAALLVVIAIIIATGFAAIDATMREAACQLQSGTDALALEVCLAGLK